MEGCPNSKFKDLPALLLPTDLDKDEISLIENIQREFESYRRGQCLSKTY